ncbi:MAG: hypothetical protein MJA30_32420 [Cytophagales bacterium]|nr:hypothetical protein [Cytophagales bacterium]
MKSKLKSIFMALAASVFMFTACQETEVFDDAANQGTAASPSKPTQTLGNGSRVFITSDRTLFSDTTYFINGEVIVRGAALTIQPGTLIRGIKDTTPGDANILNSVLVVDVDAQIFAAGDPNNPIVFTSDQPAGSRAPGDWGGVIILGPDVVNQGTEQIEGLENPLTFGGSGDSRTAGSGVIQYARIEFSGTILQDGNETNGLTVGGVSANTTLDHIQVSFGNDDGFEYFGGSVNSEFLVSWKTRDDDFDTDFGHTGYIQYAVSRRDNDFVSTEANAFETDNDGAGSNASPETNTLFANITCLGPGELEGDGSEIDITVPNVFNAGLLVRRNSATNLLNSIVTAWTTGTNLRDFETAVNYVVAPNSLRLEGIAVGLPSSGGTAIRTDNLTAGQNAAVVNRYTTVGNNTVITASPAHGNVAEIVGLRGAAFATGNVASGSNPGGTPDFTLNALLPQGAANLINAQTLPASYIARGLTQEDFRGAFSTTGTVSGGNWNFSSGWLEFDPENAVYH